MAEFIEFSSAKESPTSPVYDAGEQERIISKAMVKTTYGT
jgi:hypothetical protein